MYYGICANSPFMELVIEKSLCICGFLVPSGCMGATCFILYHSGLNLLCSRHYQKP